MRGELQQALEHRICHGTTFLGVPARKNPMDAWVYQEIIHELRPDWIVEIGNKAGGALRFFATLCDMTGHGDVLGVDIDHDQIWREVPYNQRIQFVTGDAIDVFPKVAEIVAGRSCLVIEDSAHTYDHTLAVLRTYGVLVQPGGYMICEDGVMPEVERALKTFSKDPRFEADRSREWPVTWNPKGFLRRVG